MRSPRTRFVRGRPVMEPKGQAPLSPPGNACRARLQSCGMVIGDLNLVHETMESRIWHAETDRGPREVSWNNVSGWNIKPLDASPTILPLLAPCSACEAPTPASKLGKCHWCGRMGLCRECISRDGHSCEGTAST